jgi:hypothetical protein
MSTAWFEGEGVMDDRRHETGSRPAEEQTSHGTVVPQKGGAERSCVMEIIRCQPLSHLPLASILAHPFARTGVPASHGYALATM